MTIYTGNTCESPNTSWMRNNDHFYWITDARFGDGNGDADYTASKAECAMVHGGKLAETSVRETLELFYDTLIADGGK